MLQQFLIISDYIPRHVRLTLLHLYISIWPLSYWTKFKEMWKCADHRIPDTRYTRPGLFGLLWKNDTDVNKERGTYSEKPT